MDGKLMFGSWRIALLAGLFCTVAVPGFAQQSQPVANPPVVAANENPQDQASDSPAANLVRADKWLAVVWKGLSDFWSYPLTTVDDRPITIGQVLAALVLFTIGYIASRWMSWSLGQHLT